MTADDQPQPRTAAGRALYDAERVHNQAQRTRADDRHDEWWLKRILAIEAEAVAAERERLRVEVEALQSTSGSAFFWHHPDGSLEPLLTIAAVRALLEPAPEETGR